MGERTSHGFAARNIRTATGARPPRGTRDSIPWVTIAAATAAVATGCYSGGEPLEGFGHTAAGDGPRVVWDLDAKPLPEIPLPNDLATRTDLTSPTGRRLNPSREAKTSFERRLRNNMANLDGWGTFAPLWVQFDSRLDLINIAERQTGDTKLDDDLVFLIDVTRDSPTYGEAQILDFGNGSFPIGVDDPDDYFTNDPRVEASNLLYDTYDEDARGDGDGHCDRWEDLDQDGQLDAGEDVDGDGHLDIDEDTDADGVCDKPNLWGSVLQPGQTLPHHAAHPGHPDHPYFDLISFYELETNTLTFRPLVPLREHTTYAVVLTKDLVGENGDPIRSPWEYVHHLQQLEDLAPLFEDNILHDLGVKNDDVAFAWTFTTQSIAAGLVALREGVHGVGPFAHLAEEYPAQVEKIVPMSENPGAEAYLMRPEDLVAALQVVFENVPIAGFDATRVGPLLDTYGSVDYLVAGDYISPDFLAGGGGVFDINPQTGTGSSIPVSLRFLLVVPKPAYGTAPFPVMLYCHGYGSLKLEALAFAGILAKYGIATFVIDAYGHGIPFGSEIDIIISAVVEQLQGQGLEPFFDAITEDRARDLNGDGFLDSGGDFWTADTFHTRDIIRQTLFDYLQALRMLQGFDGVRTWPFDLTGDATGSHLAGDFNNDGVIDVGGPDAEFYTGGMSMGGIHSSVLGAIDPAIVASAPVSPGGGLLDIGMRTDLGTAIRPVILPILGPMVITEPQSGAADLTLLEWLVNDVANSAEELIGRVGLDAAGNRSADQMMRAGDILRVINRTNDTADEVVINAARRVRAHIPADKGDEIVIEVYRPGDPSAPGRPGSRVRVGQEPYRRIDEFEFDIGFFNGVKYKAGDRLVAIQEGLGYRRNTPSLRRLLAFSQTILEPADPVSYAPHYADPLDIRPEGRRSTNILYTVTMGDMTVPVSTGIALGRAAGIIGYRTPDPRYGITQNQLLIDRHVTEGLDQLMYFQNDCCYAHCGQVNFDIDDLSDGHHEEDLPRLAENVAPTGCGGAPPDCRAAVCESAKPLHATVQNGNGFNAVRFPALSARGTHVIDLPVADAEFDPSMFVINQIGLFLGSGGTVLSDNACLAHNDCSSCSGEDDCPAIPAPTSIPLRVGGP